MVVKYAKWLQNIPTFSIPRPSKIYPSRGFWSGNNPSGNPDLFLSPATIFYPLCFHLVVKNGLACILCMLVCNSLEQIVISTYTADFIISLKIVSVPFSDNYLKLGEPWSRKRGKGCRLISHKTSIEFSVPALLDRVARFFLVHDTKTGKNVPCEHNMYRMVTKYPKYP
jgi:hypothetical protein